MRCVFFFSFLLIPIFLLGQSAELPLNFSSYAIKLSVGKDESLALTTRVGEVGLAASIKENWHRADVTTKNHSIGATLDQPNFFNKDTGFVSGFVAAKNGKYDIIYHTTDGGLKWQTVSFGQDGWVDDAVNLDNGEAWLSVAGSGIAYTSDYGFTWKKLKNPQVKQRFASIFFNTKRQGIVGSLWNMIAYTEDNCKTWRLLPTPLDQGKYNKTNKLSRPEFNEVAIFKDYFLAKQEDLVFYSKRDSVSWIWLPDYSDFYTDPENSALFFKTNKENYVRSDSNFIPIHVFEGKENAYDAKCKNGSLFIVTNDQMIQLNTSNQPVYSLFIATAAAGITPIYVGYTVKGLLGMLDNKIFMQQDYNGAWTYLFTFPFSLEKGVLSVIGEALLMYDRKDDSLFYFDLTGKLDKVESKKSMIASFNKSGIKKLIFSQGSRGCFHNYVDQLVYTNYGGEFGGPFEINHDAKSERGMPDNKGTIEEEEVLKLVHKLPLLFDPTQKATIDDLRFSQDEYDQCKRDIHGFQASLQKKKNNKETSFSFNRNNLDFNRLLRLVDSIKNINTETLNSFLFNLSELWSTTTNWKKIELINGRGEVLSIASYYYEPNAFMFPWIVSLNGYTISTTNMEPNRFIEKAYPAFLNNANRVKVLHSIVKKLY